jgi:hypothetical protein
MAAPPLPPVSAYPEPSQAVLALVLGILHFVVCPILGPIGWYLAKNEEDGIAAGRRDPANASLANAAKIVGIIGTVLLGLGVLFFLVVIIGFGGLAFFADA